MPSSVTHDYFAQDVYNGLNKNIKIKLKDDINYLKAFGQGPDPYFFYDFHLTKRSKRIFEINDAMQHSKVNEHFISLIKYINNKNYYDNNDVIAYLYGQICHFVLDTTTHPYIIYYTGIYDAQDPKTYKYNGKHEEMEYYIDIYLINKREKIKPRKFKVYRKIIKIKHFSSELKDTIDTIVKEVYGFDQVSYIYYKSLKDMKRFYRVLNYDRFGFKKLLYKTMDFIFQNKSVKKQELSFFVAPESKMHYLNKEKTIWYNPYDPMEKYNFSFEELYDIAITKAIKIIETVDLMLKNKDIKEKKLKSLFGNLNYATGKDCNLNIDCKCFKF